MRGLLLLLVAACRIHADAEWYCWGANDFGQIGNGGTTGSVTAPAQVLGLATPVAEIRAGVRSTCTRDMAGVECWGRNVHGQLGWLTAADSLPHPTPMPVPLGCP